MATLNWKTPPPSVVKRGRIITPAPEVELLDGTERDVRMGDVTVSLRDGRPLGGSTVRPLVDGVATFPDLSINELGPAELVAQVDTDSLVYPGISSEEAVLLYRFDAYEEGSTQVTDEVTGSVLSISSGYQLTGNSLRKGVATGQCRFEGIGSPEVESAIMGDGFVRMLYKTISGGQHTPDISFRTSTDSISIRAGTANEYERWTVRVRGSGVGAIVASDVLRGVAHLLTASWSVGASSTFVRIWVDGVLVGSGTQNQTPYSGVDSVWLFSSSAPTGTGAIIGQEIFSFGLYQGTTTDEAELLEARRCGVA